MKERLGLLVPGFFGFSSVGAVNYFDDVERALGLALRRCGAAARIVRCATQPTASIPRRADVLRRQVIRAGGLRACELHFVGHSTGGLDVRADHLDLVGHYTQAGGTANWLPSGAGYTPAAFDATWDAIAGAIARGRRSD